MAYSVAGLVREFRPPGYPQDDAIVPHGMSVIVNAPSVFRFTSSACPERHIHGASCLGAETLGASESDAGEVLARHLIRMMKQTGIPNGIAGVGYHEGDIGALCEGAVAQQRLLTNSPRPVGRDDLADLYRGAMQYW